MPVEGETAKRFTPVNNSQMLEGLRSGRLAAAEPHSQQLMHLLAKKLAVQVLSSTPQGRNRHGLFSRVNIRVRGFEHDELHIMILAGTGTDWAAQNQTLWSRIVSSSNMPFIFACGEKEYEEAKSKVGSRFALVWSPQEILSFLDSSNPFDFFKQLLRKRFSLELLHPFDYHHPASTRRFIGRHELLQRLRDNPQTNYALVGPSKMGKTSLVDQYQRPERGGSDRRTRQFYLDLYAVGATDHALSRAIRMVVDSSKSSYYDKPENLPGFLEKAKGRLGGPLELILDEVDKHCSLEVMRVLIHLAQRRVCRLILVGRWKLSRKEPVHTDDR